jgi:hypothetical protein
MIKIFLAIIALSAVAIALPALSRDLPRNDPERLAILDAARSGENIQFVVKDLFKAGDFAYLCALKMQAKGILGTDEDIDVYQWVLLRQAGNWQALSAETGLAENSKQAECLIHEYGRQVQTAKDLQKILATVLRREILDELDYGIVTSKKVDFFDDVIRQKLVADFSIEHVKQGLSDTQQKIAKSYCKIPACEKEAESAFRQLNERKNQSSISSLAWQNCQYALRVGDLPTILRCVEATVPLPYCRPNMKMSADRPDIRRCLDTIHQRCLQDFPRQRICR